MERAIRVKVEAGERMRTFCLAHPDEDPGFRLVQTGFEERLQRIGALALQEAHERRNATTAFRRKRALRLQLQSELLTHLARVSEVAARERPELADRFRLPTSPQAFRPFLTAATAIIEEADSLAELLVKHGMSETMFRELRATMAQLEAATETARRTRLVHVRARSELAAVAGEMMDLVKVLDGLNRYRFRGQPELLSEWERASHVATTRPAGTGNDAPPAGPDLSTAA